MKIIIKIVPEIFIKSKPVRLKFMKILIRNISNILKLIHNSTKIMHYWDYIKIFISEKEYQLNSIDALTNIPGIHTIAIVKERFFKNILEICEHTLFYNKYRLIGKSFCVRAKRYGKHDFTSQDIEKYVGFFLQKNIKGTTVNLNNPDEIILLEIKNEILFLIIKIYKGLGGFPISTQGSVLSLISGGFDSGIASYMLMRRGCKVNYCFFNLSGVDNEYDILEMIHYLWSRFSSSHKAKFISINFSTIMNEILSKVNISSEVGIILKRMMLRAATTIAKKYNMQAIVTGEVIGQVSSQTIINLKLINSVSDTLVIRPLISYDKEYIINFARKIGIESFVNKIPEYCGFFSKNATAKSSDKKIEYLESNFNFLLLNESINQAKILEICNNKNYKNISEVKIESKSELNSKDVILDIRPQYEQENNPLHISNIIIKSIPFYKLADQFANLDQNKYYFLYCNHGFMSKLQAMHLHQRGFQNVKVYSPK